METDVKIVTEEHEFKLRACGIVCKDNKFLLVRIKNNNFYCLPGGHVELGEDTEHAVIREMKEETGYNLKINKLLAITENFYNKSNKRWHEIAYYYLMEPLDNIQTENKTIIENDKGELKKLEFIWWDTNEELPLEIKPVFIKEKLKNRDFELENIIVKE